MCEVNAQGVQMRIARILLLLALIEPALARPPFDGFAPLYDETDLMGLDMAHGTRFSLGLSSWSAPPVQSRSSVFTTDYWSRAYEERAQLEARYGVRLAFEPRFEPYGAPSLPALTHQPMDIAGGLRWNAQPLAGLQFERHNLFMQGDRLSFRASSDVQTLFREAGLVGSGAELDALSLLGWRSHSQLVWELGEPTRELRWQFTAHFDRRAEVQSNSAGFNVLRRF